MASDGPRGRDAGGPYKRAFERIRIPGELQGEVMVFQPMVIRELSRGGAEIETAFPLHLDSLHDFRLRLGERSVVIKGRVVHSRISDVEEAQVRYRSGIEFVEASNRFDAAITAFLDSVMKSG